MRRLKYIVIFALLACFLYAESILSAENQSQGSVNDLSSGLQASGAALDSVVITGVDSLTCSELNSVILSSAGMMTNKGLIEYDSKAIVEFMRERGWWNATVDAFVDSIAGEPVVLTYSVETGARVKCGKLVVAGDNALIKQEIRLPELYGKPFVKSIIESVTSDIVLLFSDHGYPGASAIPLLTANSDTVDVVIKILAGERAYIDSFEVRGLEKTRDYVVLRELNHIRGMPAGREAIETAENALRRLNYLQSANEPYIDYSHDGKGILVLELEEKRTGTFDGIVGYQPEEGGDSGELIGMVNISLANMFGTGRSSKIRWEKLGGQTEDLEISYSEPRVLGLPYNISAGFLQEERERHGYTRTRFDLNAGRNIGRLNIDFGLRYEKVSSDSLNSSNATGMEAKAGWNGVDNSGNPRSGIRYAASWSLLVKKYRFGSKKKTTVDRVEVDLDHYIPTFKRQTVALLLRYRRVDAGRSSLDLSDRYWLGGASSIRGYREQLFPAVKALWSSIEYRFLTGGPSRFFIFVDTGYLIDYVAGLEGSFVRKSISRTGYGFGLRLQSRAGTLGFDYGLGKGDSPGQGKLHVRLSAEF